MTSYDLHVNSPIRHLVHASDHEQAKALLTRWGPDQIGKLGSKLKIAILFDSDY